MEELLQIAVRAVSMSAVRDVLGAIGEKTGSDVCILWRSVPRDADEPEELFVAADWSRDEHANLNHSLPMNGSVTGRAIREHRTQIVSKLRAPDRDDFLTRAGMTGMYAIPITFPDGVKGALNLYSRESRRAWEDIEDYGSIVPALLSIIHDQVSLRILRGLEPLLGSVGRSVPSGMSLFEHIHSAISDVCREIALTLNCLEVSIFLEDAASRTYRLAGTAYPQLASRTSYTASEDDGLTGWSLAHPEAKVLLFDLRRLEESAARYPGLRTVSSLLTLRIDDELAPLSFMSAPILDGSAVVGLIRCSVGRGPVFFDERQRSLLEQVAARIAPVWAAMVRNRSLESAVRNFRHLNSLAHEELMNPRPDQKRILSEALRIMTDVVPGAETLDVRLLSADGRQLEFAALIGQEWASGTTDEQEARQRRVFPVDNETPRSSGALVVRTGKTHVVADPQTDLHHDATFPSTKRMIVAPLALGSDVYGVLDIRSSAARDFPDFAVAMTELLGSQLALYRQLADRVAQLSEMRQREIQIYEGLGHELRSPLIIAHRTITEMVRRAKDSDLKSHTLRVRALLGRATHVTFSLGLMTRLAHGDSIPLSPVAISGNELLRLIRELTQDASYLARGEQQDHFVIDSEAIESISVLHADRVLLEQALTQLLDNAFKYSFSDAVVTVGGGSVRRGNSIRISITNVGIPLRPTDVERTVIRGWQSDEARMVSGYGSGIGLWIVDSIMRAHGGAVEVTPTDQKGRTTVALLFPEVERRDGVRRR